MPSGVARVYPASRTVAMLPLTPANNYTPTMLFCAGSDMPADYRNYSWPFYNTWTYPASKDCQRLTPEPLDGSAPACEQDGDILLGRTMGQFVSLPDGTVLVIDSATNGTAGFANQTLYVPSLDQMPFFQSLASGPVGTPAIYNPNAPKGSRWSNAGLGSSSIARMSHSTTILLPDASVLIAGSNPNLDVELTVPYPTTYTAEIFYPPYFWSSVRPQVTGVPQTLSYGVPYFNLTVSLTSYNGTSSNFQHRAPSAAKMQRMRRAASRVQSPSMLRTIDRSCSICKDMGHSGEGTRARRATLYTTENGIQTYGM